MASLFSDLSHLRLDGSRPVALLSLSALKSVDSSKLAALAKLEITTLSELLHFEPIHRARTLMAVSLGKVGHELDLDRYLADPPASAAGLASLGTGAVLGINARKARVLKNDFGVETVAQLADFEPFREAEALVAEQSAAFSEAASAPDELIPRYRGAAPTTRARYSSFVREDTVDAGLSMTLGEDVPDFFDKSLARLFIRLDPRGGLRAGGTQFRPDLGFALLHEQSWTPIGLQLGEPLKAIGLLPDEKRKVAIIDWRQSLSARRGEAALVDEQLNSLLVHQRALDEVVRTTAEEHQAGRTDTIAATGLGAAAGVASGALVGAIGGAVVGGITGGVAGVPLGAVLGLLGGGGTGAVPTATTGGGAAPTIPAGAAAGVPAGAGLGGLGGTLSGSILGSGLGSLAGGVAAAIGGSLLASASGAIGHVESSSEGDREIFGRLNQNIMDVAMQKASNVRSLRSSVVVDVTQSEQENLTTYVIANNNRAHALTVVYFELLNKYAVETKTIRVDPLIYLPFNPLRFDFALMAKYWHVLRLGIGDPKLTDPVDEFLASLDFFDGSLEASAGDREEPRITGMTVSVIVAISITDLTSFKCIVEKEGGDQELEYLETRSVSTGGVRLRFRDNSLSIRVDKVEAIRIRFRNTLGTEITVTVDEMKIDLGDGRKIVRNVRLGSKRFRENLGVNAHSFAFDAGDRIKKREEAQRDEQLAIDRVLDVLNRRTYFFTRFVLTGIDPAELEDLIELLEVESPGGQAIRLISLIDPRPIGFVGGSIVFRLKRDPDLDFVMNAEPARFVGLHSKRFVRALPKLDLPADTVAALSERLEKARRGISPAIRQFLDYIGEIAEREREERSAAAERREIALPTAGVFAEAILGRSIAAEKIDPTRYIAWDLPSPNAPPDIAALQAGGRGQGVPDLAPTVPGATLSVTPPIALPDPSGFAGAFAALAAANLFRDMSKGELIAATLAKLADVAATGAAKAGDLAGDAQKGALDSATSLATKVADTAARVADTAASLTEFGAKLNSAPPAGAAPTTTPPPTTRRPPTTRDPGVPPPTIPSPVIIAPTPTATPAPATNERTIGVRGTVMVENGPNQSLPGFYSINLVPPGDQLISSDKGVLIETADGLGNQRLVLEPDTYAVRGIYQVSPQADLLLLRNPQGESLGLGGDSLIRKVMNLFQRDLVRQLTESASIRPDTVVVAAPTVHVQVDVLVKVGEAHHAQFDLSFDLGDEFNQTAGGQVAFDTSKLSGTADKIADALRGGFADFLGNAAGVAGDALKAFTIGTNIGLGNVLQAGANGKVTLSFKPCFLQDFALTATAVS